MRTRPIHPLELLSSRDALKGMMESLAEIIRSEAEVRSTVVNPSETALSGTVVVNTHNVSTLGYVEQSQTTLNTLDIQRSPVTVNPKQTVSGDKLTVPPHWALPPPTIDKIQEIRDRAARARDERYTLEQLGAIKSYQKEPKVSRSQIERDMRQEASQRSLSPKRKIEMD